MSIRAQKAVILATGGSTSNVNFRRMFDPRLTEVYQVAGEPYSFQDGSGELAAMAIGASLWGLANQTLENGDNIRVKRAIGCQYNYSTWDLASPIFPLVRATGLGVKDWHDLILVNQVGQRFYDETKGDYPTGNKYKDVDPYTPASYHNAANINYDATRYNFFNAAVAMNGASAPPDYSAGPVWAIFDSEATQLLLTDRLDRRGDSRPDDPVDVGVMPRVVGINDEVDLVSRRNRLHCRRNLKLEGSRRYVRVRTQRSKKCNNRSRDNRGNCPLPGLGRCWADPFDLSVCPGSY